MKRGTPDHPKTLALQELLGIDDLQVVGLLERLFHFAAKYSPQGDIGRWSDERIAQGVRWKTSSSELVSQLVQSGWLDTHAKYRLLVHDWSDHCEEAVKKHLTRHGLSFLGVSRRRRDHVETPSSTLVETPSSTPKEGKGRVRAGNGKALLLVEENGFSAFWSAYRKKSHRREAEDAWRKLRPPAELQTAIMLALAWQFRQPRWLEDGCQYAPNPATYLNGQRWLDEPPPASTNGLSEREAKNLAAGMRFIQAGKVQA